MTVPALRRRLGGFLPAVARSKRAAVALVLAGVLGRKGESQAFDAGSPEHRSRIVARIGPTTVTMGQLEDRIATLPPFQRASFGARAEDVCRRFLTEVLIHDELLSLAAATRRLAEEQPAAYRLERARSSATIRALRARLGPAASIPVQDVNAYYDRNRERYETAERLQIWRILCKTRDEARAVLDTTRRDPAAATFEALARDHSLDKATRLRGGNLGFLTADGASNEPGLRADAAVMRAAQAIGDGELAPEPVAEGQYFSVVWRRATIAPIRRSVSEVAPQIRDLLWKARVKEETDKLVAKLRAAHLQELNASLLDVIDLPADGPLETSAKDRPDGASGR